MNQIRFNATSDELTKIELITVRAMKEVQISSKTDWLSLSMDIEATHCNGCKLDLDRLLKADDENFFHDICGIMRHLNRKTGKLEGFFLPRTAVMEGE